MIQLKDGSEKTTTLKTLFSSRPILFLNCKVLRAVRKVEQDFFILFLDGNVFSEPSFIAAHYSQ